MKRILILLVFIVAVFGVCAQTTSPFTGSLLWKVSGNNLEKPSYVLGTFHLFPESFVDSIPGLRDAMKATTQVVGEIDMLDMASAQTKMMQAAILPEEESYKKLLSEDEYARLDEGLKGILGVGLEQMGGFKPGMLGASLAIILYTQIDPTYNPTTFVGIDTYMQQNAREEGKSVLSLETVDEQTYMLFDSKPQKWQMESLLCTIENMDASVESMVDMIADYRAGNLNKLYNDSFHNPDDPCSSFSIASKDAMLGDRNNKWMEKLPQIMKENPSMIVVGAAHLAGEEGILYQLGKLGYIVETVK